MICYAKLLGTLASREVSIAVAFTELNDYSDFYCSVMRLPVASASRASGGPPGCPQGGPVKIPAMVTLPSRPCRPAPASCCCAGKRRNDCVCACDASAYAAGEGLSLSSGWKAHEIVARWRRFDRGSGRRKPLYEMRCEINERHHNYHDQVACHCLEVRVSRAQLIEHGNVV